MSLKKDRYDERSASWCQETGFGATSENMTQRDSSDPVCKAISNQPAFNSLQSTQHKEPNLVVSWKMTTYQTPFMISGSWLWSPVTQQQWQQTPAMPAYLFTRSFQRLHLERQKEGRKRTLSEPFFPALSDTIHKHLTESEENANSNLIIPRCISDKLLPSATTIKACNILKSLFTVQHLRSTYYVSDTVLDKGWHTSKTPPWPREAYISEERGQSK